MNENQVGVILEEVRDMFKTLAEGHDIVVTRLDRLEEGQQRLEKDVSELKQDVSVLKQDVSGLKQDVSSLKQGVARLDRKMDTVMEQTAYLTEIVQQHEVRITRVEQKIG